MNKTFSLHNLNNLDAVSFIYKNSLSEFKNHGIENMTSLSPLLSSPPSVQNRKNKDSNTSTDREISQCILKNISFITQNLLFYSNELELETEEHDISTSNNFTIEQLNFIINHFLKRFYLLSFSKGSDASSDYRFIFSYIQNIKIIMRMDFAEYCEFLKQVYRILKKKVIIPNESELNEKYIHFFVNLENRAMMERLKTEKKMEDISKLIF